MRSLQDLITFNEYWYQKEMAKKRPFPENLPVKNEYKQLFSLSVYDIEKLNTAMEELEIILSQEENQVLQDLYYLLEDITSKAIQ